MRIVYLGQPCAASLPPLRALLNAGYELGALILAGQPGGYAAEATTLAAQAGAAVHWASAAADVAPIMRPVAPDIAVAACFPWRLSDSARSIPPLGILNVHPSLLPAGRGPEPVFWTFRRGERMTGVTVHRMDAELDTGPIAAQADLPVAAGVRAPDLERELMAMGGRLLTEVLPALETGALPVRGQPETGAWPAPTPDAADWTISPLLPAAWAWHFARGVAPLRGPLSVLARDAAIPIDDALDWSPHEPMADRVVAEDDGIVRVRFSPGWVRFRRR